MDKPKFPKTEALAVAQELYDRIKPACHRCKVVGSMRRGVAFVKDIEFLIVPKLVKDTEALFDERIDAAELTINSLVSQRVLQHRLNINGDLTWGPKNKFAIHVTSGIPIDFFTTTPENWWNSLVCRTGPLSSNLKLTMAANKMGWSFEAYGNGFRKVGAEDHYEAKSEEDVFKFVGLPYADPQNRR